MPTTLSEIIRAAIRGLRPITNNLSLESERNGIDFLGKLETRKLPSNVNIIRWDIGDIPAEWFHHESSPEDAVAIYFHGGAYISGSLTSSRVLAVDFVQALQMNVLSFEYRLAPEHPFPAALDDAMKVYKTVLGLGVSPERITFIGDSAGGGLLCAAAIRSRDEGLPLPSSLVMISPWVNLTLSGRTYETMRDKEPLLTIAKLERAVECYTGNKDLKNPYISPVFGDFKGIPPTLIHVGTHELLLDDARTLSTNMARDGVDVTLDEWEGMWHVWHTFDVPETAVALERIADYILTRLGSGEVD